MTNEDVPEIQSIWDDARGFIEHGDYDKAIEIYQYTLIRHSDDPIAIEYANAYLGDIFLTLRQLDTAEEHIKKAINLKPENPAYRYILGFIYSNKRWWDKAIAEFEAAVASEPDNGEYLRGLGWTVYSSGDVDKGLASLEKANRLAPANTNILTDLAVAYLSFGNIDTARQYAEKAVRLDPINSVARDVLKRVLGFSKGFKSRGERVGKAPTRPSASLDTHFIHRFKVYLSDRPDIWRLIDIKGNQMLSSLHKAMFKAFDRFEEHPYSFFLSNKPFDRESEYTSSGIGTDGTSKFATRIRIDSVELYGGPKFLYLFDYGDEWWHEIELISVTERVTRANYPRVVKKQGKSPTQHQKGVEY